MAKFCPNCGSEMIDEAAMCVKCGTMVGENNTKKNLLQVVKRKKDYLLGLLF